MNSSTLDAIQKVIKISSPINESKKNICHLPSYEGSFFEIVDVCDRRKLIIILDINARSTPGRHEHDSRFFEKNKNHDSFHFCLFL